MDLSRYAAPCVRACALRTGLLSRNEWRTLFASESSGAALAWLDQRGTFGDAVPDVLAAERSAHTNVIRTANALLRFARGELHELLLFFVHYYDLLNVESVVRGISSLSNGDQPEQALYDTGHFGLVRRADLRSVTNYAALSRSLKHTLLSAPFDQALQRYSEDEDVTRLVEALDLAFFSGWIAAAESSGFRMRMGTDGTGLAVFLLARVMEAAVRLKVHRRAEGRRAAEWLSLVSEGRHVAACLAELNREDAESALRGLTDMLLPAVRRTTTPETGAEAPAFFLQRLILDHAIKGMGGIKFNADFLTSFLILQICQAREITVLLESKDAGISAVGCSVYAVDET